MSRNVGQLIFRDAGDNKTMVVGILQGQPIFKSEHQYVVEVNQSGQLTILMHTAKDLTERIAGDSLGGLVLQPLWNVMT